MDVILSLIIVAVIFILLFVFIAQIIIDMKRELESARFYKNVKEKYGEHTYGQTN